MRSSRSQVAVLALALALSGCVYANSAYIETRSVGYSPDCDVPGNPSLGVFFVSEDDMSNYSEGTRQRVNEQLDANFRDVIVPSLMEIGIFSSVAYGEDRAARLEVRRGWSGGRDYDPALQSGNGFVMLLSFGIVGSHWGTTRDYSLKLELPGRAPIDYEDRRSLVHAGGMGSGDLDFGGDFRKFDEEMRDWANINAADTALILDVIRSALNEWESRGLLCKAG